LSRVLDELDQTPRTLDKGFEDDSPLIVIEIEAHLTVPGSGEAASLPRSLIDG
jgi:hypothetical protein